MSADRVEDEEVLYRNVRLDDCFRSGPEKVRSSAFMDRERKPSVDRAELCDHNPFYTRRGSDGVVSLLAGEVRQIGDVVLQAPLRVYEVDVQPDPIKDHPELPDNPAHARIYLRPDSDNDKLFRRLRIALARLANQRPWEVEPEFPPE